MKNFNHCSRFALQANKNSGLNRIPKIIMEVAATIQVQEPYFQAIRAKTKTTEGRCATEIYRAIKVGELVEFGCSELPSEKLICEILRVGLYETFEEMLRMEGIEQCLPGIEDLDEAVRIYRCFPQYIEKEEKYGVIAFEIRVCD